MELGMIYSYARGSHLGVLRDLALSLGRICIMGDGRIPDKYDRLLHPR